MLPYVRVRTSEHMYFEGKKYTEKQNNIRKYCYNTEFFAIVWYNKYFYDAANGRKVVQWLNMIRVEWERNEWNKIVIAPMAHVCECVCVFVFDNTTVVVRSLRLFFYTLPHFVSFNDCLLHNIIALPNFIWHTSFIILFCRYIKAVCVCVCYFSLYGRIECKMKNSHPPKQNCRTVKIVFYIRKLWNFKIFMLYESKILSILPHGILLNQNAEWKIFPHFFFFSKQDTQNGIFTWLWRWITHYIAR